MDRTDQAIQNLAEAKENAALGAEFAPDYIDYKGLRIYYKTVSHAWVIPAVVNRYKNAGDFEKGLLVFYLLTMNAEEVRSRAMQELAEGTIVADAIAFMEDHNLTPDDVDAIDLSALMAHPYKKK